MRHHATSAQLCSIHGARFAAAERRPADQHTRAGPGAHRRGAREGENLEAVVGGEEVGAVALARQDRERAWAVSRCGAR